MEMWVDDLAFEFWDGKWRAMAFCVISFEMESGGRRIFVLSVLRWRVEGGAIC
jgi:hypothetical protein